MIMKPENEVTFSLLNAVGKFKDKEQISQFLKQQIRVVCEGINAY